MAGSATPDEPPGLERLPGERLLWSGRPAARPYFLAYAPRLALLALWICLALAALLAQANAGNGFALLAYGAALVIGLAGLAKNLTGALSARHIHYAVTDRRVLIVHAGSRQPPVSVRRESIRKVERLRGSAGFMVRIAISPRGGGRGRKQAHVTLHGIEDSGELLRLLAA